jgi:hypothetical protein
VPNTLSAWYIKLMEWVSRGNCFLQPDGLDENYPDHINPDVYYSCLFAFLGDDAGERYEDVIRFSNTTNPSDRRIIGYKISAQTIKIDSSAY